MLKGSNTDPAGWLAVRPDSELDRFGTIRHRPREQLAQRTVGMQEAPAIAFELEARGTRGFVGRQGSERFARGTACRSTTHASTPGNAWNSQRREPLAVISPVLSGIHRAPQHHRQTSRPARSGLSASKPAEQS
jgi:hypothetical protein